MTKTTVATPAQTLSEEIERLESAIARSTAELESQNIENIEFAEALRLLSVGIAPYVPEGRIKILDALTVHLNEASDQSDREYRWNAAQRALTSGQQASAILQSELEELRQQLAIAESELDWESNFKPYAQQYRSGFQQMSPRDIKDEKVAAMQRDIAQRQAQLQRAQQWLNQSESDRPYYSGNAWTEVDYLSAAIPNLSQQLERLISSPVAHDPQYEASFRSYVRARTEVEPALAHFLEIQGEYLAALEQLKEMLRKHPECAEFPGMALAQPRIVSAETSIRLADVEPMPVKARLW